MASAQNHEALNSFMERYSQTWPKQNSMGSEALKQIGQPMPEFYLNKKYNSKKLKGKFVLINFWATWCSGCRLLSVDLDSLMIKHNREEFADVQLLGVDALENMTSKGFDPDEWWASKGIGFPTVGGKGADECCKSVNGTHPCMMLIDDKGIVRGRWDAWTPSAAEEARMAVWALHVVPRDGIKADSATVEKFYSAGRTLEAAYLLSLMPEEISTTALRFKVLANINADDAVAVYDRLSEKCEKFRPASKWEQWEMPNDYKAALEDISEFVYQSDINNTSLLDRGSKAVRLLMNSTREQRIHNRTKLAVIRYRHGKIIMETGEQSLNSMAGMERDNSDNKDIYKEVEEAMHKYGIEAKSYTEQSGSNATMRRMMEVEEESKLHMSGLNDTINMIKDNASKLQAQFIVPQKMRAGKQSAVTVYLQIAHGWHAYADTEKTRNDGFIPTKVEFTLPKGFKQEGEQSTYPENIDVITSGYSVTQYFYCPDSKTLKGKTAFPVKAKLTYQICDDGQCQPPVEVEVEGVMKMKKLN